MHQATKGQFEQIVSRLLLLRLLLLLVLLLHVLVIPLLLLPLLLLQRRLLLLLLLLHARRTFMRFTARSCNTLVGVEDSPSQQI